MAAIVRALARGLVSALVTEYSSTPVPPPTGAAMDFSKASNSMYVPVISAFA